MIHVLDVHAHTVMYTASPRHTISAGDHAALCVWGGGGLKLGWPIVAGMRRSRPRSQRTFVFDVDPLTNMRAPSLYLQDPRSAPLWGPTSENFAVFGRVWVG